MTDITAERAPELAAPSARRSPLAALLVAGCAGLQLSGIALGDSKAWILAIALALPLAGWRTAHFPVACLTLAGGQVLVAGIGGLVPWVGLHLQSFFGRGFPSEASLIFLLLAVACHYAPRPEALIAFGCGVAIMAVVVAKILLAVQP